jgi:N4-gp56 family major capsid protein
MAGSTTTTLASLIPAITAEAMFIAGERSIMRGLVKNYTLAPGQGKTVTVPNYPIQTAAAYTEANSAAGTEITTTTITAGSSQLTVSTAAIRALVTDLSVASAASNVIADLGRLFGEAISRKIDADLMALFSGFSTTAGSASTALSAATIAQAAAKLRAAGVPAQDLACVVNPYVAYDLKANITNTFANPNAGIMQNQAMATGYVGTLFGIPVYESSLIANTGTVGDYVGALFHREALGLAMIGDINIETQRRASLLGTDIVASCHYGVGELYDGYGVAITADSSLLDPA